jgi:hypothetical protein
MTKKPYLIPGHAKNPYDTHLQRTCGTHFGSLNAAVVAEFAARPGSGQWGFCLGYGKVNQRVLVVAISNPGCWWHWKKYWILALFLLDSLMDMINTYSKHQNPNSAQQMSRLRDPSGEDTNGRV